MIRGGVIEELLGKDLRLISHVDKREETLKGGADREALGEGV